LLRKEAFSIVITLLLIGTLALEFKIETGRGINNSKVYIDPQIVEKYTGMASVGDTFKVCLKIGNFSDLSSYEYKLAWNKTVLNVVNVKDMVPYSLYSVLVNETNNDYNATHGRSWFSVKDTSGKPLTGNLTLRVITFKIMSAPSSLPDSFVYSKIDLFDTAFRDPDENLIIHLVSDGEFIYRRRAIMYIDPPKIEKTTKDTVVGDTFKVNITIADVNNLVAYEYKLYWNRTILNFVEVKDYVPYSEYYVGTNRTTNDYNSTHGRCYFVVVDVTLTGIDIGPEGLTIREIIFRIMKAPLSGNDLYTKIDLAETKMADPGGLEISHDALDCEFVYLTYQESTIFVDPQKVEKSTKDTVIGDTFKVNITIAGFRNLATYEYKLYWNKTILNFVNVSDCVPYSSYYVSKNETNNNYDANHGRFWFSVVDLSNTPANIESEGFIVRNITFKIMSAPPSDPGTYLHTTINLTDTIFANPNLNPIIHDAYDGEFIFKRASYTLKLVATYGGTTNPTPGVYNYVTGTDIVVITAIPDPYYILDHWSIDGVNKYGVTQITITMNMNHTIWAMFPPFECAPCGSSRRPMPL
jgi:hypothetical protein